MHVDSKFFLKGRNISSKYQKNSYSLELSKSFGSGMIFVLQSNYKHRHTGDKIFFNEEFELINTKFNLAVCFNLNFPVDIEEKSQEKNVYITNEIRAVDSRFEKYEVFLTENSKAKWKLHLYSDCREKNDHEIRGYIIKKKNVLN